MANKAKVLLWYMQRPKMYLEFINQVFGRLGQNNRKLEKTRDSATRWCESVCVNTESAIDKLSGSPLKENISEKYKDYFAYAETEAESCPVKMGGAANLDLIYSLVEWCKAEKVLETGVAYGWSSLSILLSLKNREDSHLVSTDAPYVLEKNDPYVGCVVRGDLLSHWTLLKYPDRQALPKALKKLEVLDMCHYDSDKSYVGRMWAYPLLWNAIRSGGIFMSDDIGDNLAFHDFCQSISVVPIVIKNGNKYSGVVLKN